MLKNADFSGFSKETLTFLKDLKANNTREWFADNKPVYERAVKSPADAFCAVMAGELEALTGVSHKPKTFRIHRDVRFSKDKTPYNAHVRISFTPETELVSPPAWFFGVEPGHCAVGVGVFVFDRTVLERFRARIDGEDGAALAKLIKSLERKNARMSEPDLKRVPREFPQDHVRADLLRHKGLAAWIDHDDTAAVGPGIVKTCQSDFSRLKPLFDWLYDT